MPKRRKRVLDVDGRCLYVEYEVPEYTNSQMSFLIDEYIHSERDRGIMKRRLCDKISLEKLAEEFQMSRKRIWQIVQDSEEILFKHIPG